MSERIYIHETIDIVGHQKADYVNYMCEYGPIARESRKILLFGIWTVVGSSGPWPKAINMWEAKDWDGMAWNFSFETDNASGYDDAFLALMKKMAATRNGGFDRIMAAPDWSPDARANAANPKLVGSKVFVQETIKLKPGTAKDYLERVRLGFMPLAEKIGATLTVALRTMMHDDSEVTVIWALRDWSDWARWEEAVDQDANVRSWIDSVGDIRLSRDTFLMCSGSKSPLQTGQIL